MSVREFETPEARARATEAVKAIESHTAAEIVIALRRSSDRHRDVEYVAGFALALIVTAVMLYAPPEFDLWAFLPVMVLSFIAGALLVRSIPPLKRALLAKKRIDESVRKAARDAFVELGISRTRARSGVLIYVSMLELRVEPVLDLGVDGKDSALQAQLAAVAAAISGTPRFDAFIAALQALGPILGRMLPRGEDDVNELPDEVSST